MINGNYLDILKGKYILKELWKDKFYGRITNEEYTDKRTDVFYCLKFGLYECVRYLYKDYINKRRGLK